MLSEEEVKEIKESVEKEIEEAIRISEEDRYPDPEELLDPCCMLYKEEQE